MAINHRQIEMFRADEADLPKVLAELHKAYGNEADLLRIARINEQIVAGYALLSPIERQGYFDLNWISVLPEFRRQGVGRWMAGHAMGVAESKSGRGLRTRHRESERFFRVLGFTVVPTGGFTLEFFPE